ncbi:hypothetical protein B0T14DRAFT_527383 [Immersiella caudata]|uniref:Uncharacterized protein n=1 Tax=Immersiella caudata TaxID=314043 RepID=A0AA39WEJ4_9PEZI|nr:hypothetical protein B0T14DRAFT_527383 [Immersiella caudata]
MWRLFWPGIGFLSLVLSITGAELIISWNHLKGVGQMDSTGQLIPVILGGGLLWATLLEWGRSDENATRFLGLILDACSWAANLLRIKRLINRNSHGPLDGDEGAVPVPQRQRRVPHGYLVKMKQLSMPGRPSRLMELSWQR